MLKLPKDDKESFLLNRAIYSLYTGNSSNENFQLVLQWLRDERQRLFISNSQAKIEVDFRWQQGAIQLLHDFLRLTNRDRVSELLDKLAPMVKDE
ncbi:MAG: hypothetical protein SWO11_16965 [Thermodesulfobacteriota bacterium]|nr:hypothetical protein [Thermodesulfobacteriota bacterium]